MLSRIIVSIWSSLPLPLIGGVSGGNLQQRRFVETVGPCIKALFLRKIHAVTPEGLIMKLKLFVLSYNVQLLLKVAT